MTVTANDPRPPSIQIADALRAEITAGALEPGQRLPSIRELSERFGVSSATVQSALRVLRDEYLIFSAGNRGTFVSDSNGPTEEHGDVAALAAQVGELRERVAALELAVRTVASPHPES